MKYTLLFILLICCEITSAQNEIITPTGQPLKVGINGLKLANITSDSAVGPSNGKVLSVDNTGKVFLAPSGSSQWTTNAGTIYYAGSGLTNVGIGTNNPVQKLDVNGNINISGGKLMVSNVSFLGVKGSYSTFLGSNSAQTNTGWYNTFLGFESGKTHTSGDNNTFIGGNSGVNSTGGNNTIVGAWSGQNNTGSANIFMGISVGNNNTGGSNIFMGWAAGYTNSSGSDNLFLGQDAGYYNTTGSRNIYLGRLSGHVNTTGSDNIFLGKETGYWNTGSQNVFIGRSGGTLNSTGQYNTFLGHGTGSANTTGSSNTFIGRATGQANTTGTSNIAIGAGANFGAANLTNSTVIGAGATVAISNAIVLGTSASKVGIGTSSPANNLEINSSASNTSGLRFTNLTSDSPTSTSNNRALSVNSSGDVILVPVAFSSARLAAEQNFWQQLASGHLAPVNSSSIVIGAGITKIPNGYNLYVSEGILTEKVKVAIKNTTEWSDYVFNPGYQLPSLELVDKFIKKNGHLPGIPSADEMVQKGNDLVKTDAILLQKIEELMLYSIEQEKRLRQQNIKIDTQQKDIETLKALVSSLIQQKELKSKTANSSH